MSYYTTSLCFSKTVPNQTFNEVKDGTVNLMISLYGKVPQPIVSRDAIEKKLKKLLADYDGAKKGAETSKKAVAFKEQLSSLFDISMCKCEMVATFSKGMMLCSCEPANRIHEGGFSFMKDQRTARNLHIAASFDATISKKYETKVIRRQVRMEASLQLAAVTPPASPNSRGHARESWIIGVMRMRLTTWGTRTSRVLLPQSRN